LEQPLYFGTPSRIVGLEWDENVARIGRTFFYFLEATSRLLDSIGRRAANGHRLKRHVPTRAQVQRLSGDLNGLYRVACEQMGKGQ
jgi:hypothetical protein